MMTRPQDGQSTDITKRHRRRTAIFRWTPPPDFDPSGGTLRVEMRHESVHPRHLIGRFRISVSDQEAAGFGENHLLPEAVLAALRVPPAERTAEQSKGSIGSLRDARAGVAAIEARLAAAEQELKEFRSSLQTMLVSETVEEPRAMRVLPRGNWLDDSGDLVTPSVPRFPAHARRRGAACQSPGSGSVVGRPENPLTARTLVNRLWKLFHGRGLSRNLDDLGGQGEAPTHPRVARLAGRRAA